LRRKFLFPWVFLWSGLIAKENNTINITLTINARGRGRESFTPLSLCRLRILKCIENPFGRSR
jgi:hypothetical protein